MFWTSLDWFLQLMLFQLPCFFYCHLTPQHHIASECGRSQSSKAPNPHAHHNGMELRHVESVRPRCLGVHGVSFIISSPCIFRACYHGDGMRWHSWCISLVKVWHRPHLSAAKSTGPEGLTEVHTRKALCSWWSPCRPRRFAEALNNTKKVKVYVNLVLRLRV